MKAAQFTPEAMQQHRNLAHRLTALLSTGVTGQDVRICDEAEEPVPNCRDMALRTGRSPALERIEGTARLRLTYTDAMGEATLSAAVAAATRPGMPIAVDPESLSILALAERLADSDIPVLITGPTGTGKEVLSRFIHESSARRKGPFIAINCAAMPETMLEAMLFGHEKGSFTGANAASEGFFRAADGGTLLLDEIAEMPLTLQAKLLRALQEGEVVPIGSTRPVKVDVRIIACANRDLPDEVEQGRFRADLYYRLNVFPLALRALNERPQDIGALAFSLLLRHTPAGRPIPWISDAALAMLKLHSWPGNVRELENIMRRALLLAQGKERIEPDHIAFDHAARSVSRMEIEQPQPSTAKLSNIVQLSEARAIMATLEACGGRRAAAAKELGISERTLRYRLASFREAGLAVNGGRA
ncbi:MAG: sigma 54-interacting transcriptional regulator [Novosphingobium sp.]